MRSDRASQTAELVCLCRALDQHRPASARVLDDPYAEWFLSPLARAAFKAAGATGRLGRWAERSVLDRLPRGEGAGWSAALAPAIVTYIQVRHRFIDDALLAALAAGAEQVVIAGAGYDCRAYRFADRLEGRPVFELDFPSTSRRKAKIVAAHADRLPPAAVTQVEIDFQAARASEALAQTTFDPRKPTFFVWEGVSMYLSRAAVKDTLQDFRGVAAPGSQIAFDLWYLLDAPDLIATAHRITPNLFHFVGEPIVFGMHPEDLPDFLRRQGLQAEEVARISDLSSRYLRDGRELIPGVYVARASFEPS